MSTLTPEEIAQLRANDKDDIRHSLLVGHSVCLGFAVVAIVLRFWVRQLTKTRYGGDDWVILGSLVLTAIYVAFNFEMILNHHMGQHIWWLDDPVIYVKLVLVAEIAYTLAIPFIKCSILLLYYRIFPQQWLQRSLLGLGLFLATYALTQSLTSIFQCTPVESLWGAAPKKHCINFPVLVKVGGIITILTDVITLALPIPSLLKLNLSPTRKRLLIITFLIGGIACVVSIVRLFFVDKVGNTHDSTWDVAIPALISTVELSVGILAACLPTYRPFITRLLGRTGDTHAPKPGSYLPVKDSIHIPITNHYSKHGTHTDLDNDDMEMLAGKTGQQTPTHAMNQDGTWRGPQGNEIRVTTSFKTSTT